MSQKALSNYKDMVFQHCKPLNMKWIEQALDSLLIIAKTHDKTHDFRRRSQKAIPQLEQVILEVSKNPILPVNKLLEEKLGISIRTAQKYTQILSRLRWLAKDGWGWHILNPFLELLTYLYPKKIGKIVKFASLQIDLLDLFACPLQLALEEDEVSKVEIIWSHFYPPWRKYFPKQAYYLSDSRIKMYWNGLIQIRTEGEKQDHHAILPYNIHWTGRNCHITLPIPFRFYGVESCAYSKGKLKVHFDNSIKTTIPLGSASWTTRKLLHKYGQSHWSDRFARFMEKYWKNEYVECFDFNTHEKIMRDRLINEGIPTQEMADKDFIMKQFLAY